MKYLMTGINTYDFTDQKTKQQVKGNSIHLIDCNNDQKGMIFGRKTAKFSISDDQVRRLLAQVPKESDLQDKPVEIAFDSYGRPDTITLIK